MPELDTRPGRKLFSITPSNSTVFQARALYVGTSGDLTVVAIDDDTPVTIPNAYVGWHPIAVKKVMATGTAASGIVGMTF